MKKFLRTLLALGMLLVIGISLSACASSATKKAAQDNSQQSADSAQNTSFKLYHGTFLQGNGVVSVPVIADNGSQKDVLLASRNIKLYVDGQKVDVLQAKGQPSDFHTTVSAQSTWNSILTFYIGTTLSVKDLGNVQLTFITDDNKKIIAEGISKDKASDLLSNDGNSSSSSMDSNDKITELNDYYTNIIDFQKDQLTNSTSSESLSDKFNDSQYDNFHTFMVTSSKTPDQALVFIHNGTNTDFELDLSDLEVINKDGEETLVDPEFRNYSVQIPHGKYINVLIKLEAKLDPKESPYTIRFKDKDGDFFDTSKAPYPVEFAMNSATNFENAFVGAPDELGDSAVKWTKPKLKGNNFTVKLKLTSYFNLKANVGNYELVGVDKDGNEGDHENAKSGAPDTVTGNGTTTLKLGFDDLKNLKTYKHIYLNYRDKRLCKVK